MAQNTESTQIGNLKIKYSPNFPISPEEQARLFRCFMLARNSLRTAIARIDRLTLSGPARKETPSSTVLDTLRYHYFQFCPIEELSEMWRLNVMTIANNFRKIHLCFHGSVAIADAYATIVGREKRKILNSGVLPEYSDFKEKILSATAGVKGMVPLKKSFIAGLTPEQETSILNKRLIAQNVAATPHLTDAERRCVAEVEITEQDYGSIHINFHALLKGADKFSDRQIARTIIHEGSHKFCNTMDHAYTHDGTYPYLCNSQTLTNADSYAYAAISLAEGRLFKTDDEMRI